MFLYYTSFFINCYSDLQHIINMIMMEDLHTNLSIIIKYIPEIYKTAKFADMYFISTPTAKTAL